MQIYPGIEFSSMRNFGPLAISVNGREESKLIYLEFKVNEGILNVLSVDNDEVLHSIPSNQLREFRKAFDKRKSIPCIKISCTRILLFIKLYAVMENDIIWFGEVIDSLDSLTKPREIKREWDGNENDSILKEEFKHIIRDSHGEWRFSEANSEYSLCPTYSRIILVPEGISDTVLLHASRFRVQGRIPILSNIFRGNALMRSGQPLVGLTQKRCVQDEKLIEAMKEAASTSEEAKKHSLVIVDARPSSSAFANTLIGAGIERLECYEDSERIYLNLENIHTIRESHDRLSQQIKLISRSDGNNRALWIELEEGCAWLDHLRGILEGVGRILEALLQNNTHVLVHCSDGWDRTIQLVSLVQLCLFPRYRTRSGFKMLILKDWLSTGHRFCDRNGHHFKPSRLADLSSTNNPWNSIKNFFQDSSSTAPSDNKNEECPIFLQFIEATIQLVRQFPLNFPELTDEFLLEIVHEAYTENGEFFGNCEYERRRIGFASVENYSIAHEDEEEEHSCLVPRVERSKMILWPAYYKRYF